jgi:hypothetical protein
MNPAVNADFMTQRCKIFLLIRIEQGRHSRHKKACWYTVALQDLNNAGHALAIPVLALRELSGRVSALSEFVRFVIRIKRKCDRAACATGPRRWAQTPPRANTVHDFTPLTFGPTPWL